MPMHVTNCFQMCSYLKRFNYDMIYNQEGRKIRIVDSLELNIITFFNLRKGSRNMKCGGMIEILEHDVLQKSVGLS